MNKKIIIFISVILLILSIIIIILNIISLSKVLERQTYYASIIVADYGGFDVNGTAFTFGGVPLGSSSERKLSVKNGYDFPIVVNIIPRNGMEQFIQGRQEIIFQGQERNISIVATVPAGMEKKKYEGEIVIEIRIVK